MNEDGKMMGININDYHEPWTQRILDGHKTVETRETNSLKPYIGKRVGIIRTGISGAYLVGYMDIGEPIIYINEREFRADEHRHMVCKGSIFDISEYGVKYGYPISNVERIEKPVMVHSRGIVARDITEAMKEAGK